MKLKKRGREIMPSPNPASNAFLVSKRMTHIIIRLNEERPNLEIPAFTTRNLNLVSNFGLPLSTRWDELNINKSCCNFEGSSSAILKDCNQLRLINGSDSQFLIPSNEMTKVVNSNQIVRGLKIGLLYDIGNCHF